MVGFMLMRKLHPAGFLNTGLCPMSFPLSGEWSSEGAKRQVKLSTAIEHSSTQIMHMMRLFDAFKVRRRLV